MKRNNHCRLALSSGEPVAHPAAPASGVRSDAAAWAASIAYALTAHPTSPRAGHRILTAAVRGGPRV